MTSQFTDDNKIVLFVGFGVSVASAAFSALWAATTGASWQGRYSTRRICLFNVLIALFFAFGFVSQQYQNDATVRAGGKTVYPDLAAWSVPAFALLAFIAGDFLLVEKTSLRAATILTALTGVLYPLSYTAADQQARLIYMAAGIVGTLIVMTIMLVNMARVDFYGLAAIVVMFCLSVGYGLVYLFGHAMLGLFDEAVRDEHIFTLVLTAVALVFAHCLAFYVVPADVYAAQYPNNLALQDNPRHPVMFPAVLGGKTYIASDASQGAVMLTTTV